MTKQEKIDLSKELLRQQGYNESEIAEIIKVIYGSNDNDQRS